MSAQAPNITKKTNPLGWAILVSLAVVILFLPLPAGAQAPHQHTFHVDASRFQYSPAVLKVNPGDSVTIELAATDVVHGLAVDGYGLSITADPGKTARLSFVASRPGTFRFHCTVTCGNLHPFMNGRLVVGNNTFLIRSIALTGLVLAAAIWKSRR